MSVSHTYCKPVAVAGSRQHLYRNFRKTVVPAATVSHTLGKRFVGTAESDRPVAEAALACFRRYRRIVSQVHLLYHSLCRLRLVVGRTAVAV